MKRNYINEYLIRLKKLILSYISFIIFVYLAVSVRINLYLKYLIDHLSSLYYLIFSIHPNISELKAKLKKYF